MSDASRVAVRAVAESEFGTTPASALQTIRTTGFNFKRVTQGTTSQEVRSDAQIADWIRTGANVTGTLPFELIYGNLDTTAADFLAGAFRAAWQSDTGLTGAETGTDLLENSTTGKSFSIEAEYADISLFHAFKGCRANALDLTIVPGEIVTGTLGFMGKLDTDPAGATAGTGSAIAAVTGGPMNAVDNVSLITEAGGAIELLRLNLSISNNLRLQPIIASLGPKGIGAGRFAVTGSIEIYFEDAALITKYNAGTETSLAFTLTDDDSNAYAFSIDALKYTDYDKPNQGPEGDVRATIPFQAYLDTTTEKTLRLARTAA